jgi:HNH endonuclease
MPNDERYDSLLFPGELLRFCRRCGELIVARGPGRPRSYCGRCRAVVAEEHERARRPRGVERACRGCGGRFESRYGRRYCSQGCWYRVACARWRDAERARRGRSWERVCEVCGCAFRAKSSARYCGRGCKVVAERERRRPEVELRAAERERRREERRAAEALLRFFAGDGRRCAECGEWFVVRRGSRYCSRACCNRHARRNAKHRRRERVRRGGGSVSLAYIVERDGRRCHICGRLVRMRAKAPRPLSPTLDHLVPLADGGAHESSNVALAHFACNVARGVAGPAQLLAFG